MLNHLRCLFNRRHLSFWHVLFCACLTLVSIATIAVASSPSLPPLQRHPLPPSLAQWKATEDIGDYFSEVQTTPIGYLIWWEFPVKVYLDRPEVSEVASASKLRFEQWSEAVASAFGEWNQYLPLIEVEKPEMADIIIKREQPPLQVSRDQQTGQLRLPRARSATAQYEFYLRRTTQQPPRLAHRFEIYLTPSQTPEYTQATARHELGHALGIWGHSTVETDALYFSQVRQPPPVSPRDVNTLRKIYQQPTRLGGRLEEDGEEGAPEQGKQGKWGKLRE